MTVLLLDTNVLLFGIMQPGRITAAAAGAIRTGTLRASVVSIYEVGNKYRTGKLPLPLGVFRERVTASNVAFVPLSADVTANAAALDWPHRDPWDRIIAAQAMASDATLISSDAAFDALEGVTRLW